MKRFFFLLACCIIAMQLSAQRINHNYHNVPMSTILKQMNADQHKYIINFIYDELEDFRVTANVQNQQVPEAIQQIIGFYPIKMTELQDNILLVECIQKEQQKVIGKVVDEVGQPMGFVNVSLLNASDSSFINGGVSTEAGYFAVPCGERDAILKLTYVGYKTVTRRIKVGHLGTVSMHPDSYTVKGVTVKGHHKVDYVDHSVFTFTEEQIKNSQQSQELLATLPGLRIDPMTNKVSTFSGKSIKILINGVEATDNDLKSIEADKIKNVEYYTVPPARYAGVGTLINIHTRKLDSGYAVGFDENQAISNGFNNTNVYAKYTKGNSQFSFDYSLEYRNAANCEEENIYKMKDGDKTSTYTYNGDYHFGYANQDFNLRYLYSIDDSITFQTRFTPNIFTKFWRDDFDIKAEGNDLWQNGYSNQNRTTYSFGPSLDLYFSRKLKNNQQIVADVVGTYYHNKQGNENHLFDEKSTTILDDNMSQRNNKYSVIAEIGYTKDLGKIQLETGYKATLAKSDFKISNVLSEYKEYEYHATNDNHYAYMQIGGKLNKLNYRLSLGGTYVHTSNDDTHYNKLYFTPQMLLSYPVKNGQFALQMWSNPELPSISQLSNNNTIEIPGLIRQGNPALKSGNDNAVSLSYNLNNPYINLNVSLAAEYETNSISNYYVWKENANGERIIVSQPMNADYETAMGGQINMQIKPFKSEILSLYLESAFFHQHQQSEIIGSHHHNMIPFCFNIQSRYKDFGAYIYWRKIHTSINGAYLTSYENTCNAGIFYQHKQLQLSITCIFPFRIPEYSNETLANNILEYHHVNRIPSQRNMITLGVSYNLFSGKQKDIKKQIENRDGDKGTF